MRVNNYFNIQSFANIKRRNLLRHNVYCLPCNERSADGNKRRFNFYAC